MHVLRRIEHDILATGRVDSDHLEALRLALYAGGTAGRRPTGWSASTSASST